VKWEAFPFPDQNIRAECSSERLSKQEVPDGKGLAGPAYFERRRVPLAQFHHRKFPDYSTLLSGRVPPDDVGFPSDRLQIWYNNTERNDLRLSPTLPIPVDTMIAIAIAVIV
jgi:hypothetical protein